MFYKIQCSIKVNLDDDLFHTSLFKQNWLMTCFTHSLQECVLDIEHAVECGYPEESLYKLYMRKGQALFNMDKLQKAETGKYDVVMTI